MFLNKEFTIDLSENKTIKLIIETINNLNNNDIASEFCVAGGFAREFFHSLVSNNLYNIEDYVYNKCGDIDIFFCKTNKNVKKLSAKTFSFIHKNYSSHIERDVIEYKTIFADNVEFLLNSQKKEFVNIDLNKNTKSYWSNNKVKIKFQHVYTKYETITELINNFDFTNSMYSFVVDGNKVKFLYSKKALEFDKQKILDVNKAKNNLFCKRVKKYLSSKNLEKLSDNSISLIKNYIRDIAFKNIEIYDYREKVDQNSNSFSVHAFERSCLEILESINLLDEKDLLYFIGKWSIEKITKNSEDYSFAVSTQTVDWAIDKIRG